MQGIGVGQRIDRSSVDAPDEFIEERAVFEHLLPDLIESSEGEFAVLKGLRLLGTWATLEQATRHGRRLLGHQCDFIILPITLALEDGDMESFYVRAGR